MRWQAAGAGALILLTSTLASAHGLPPGTTQITQRTQVPSELLVGTNFGPLVFSENASPRLICAEGIGYDEGFETVLHWGASGRMVIASAAGLFSSTDGCTWTPAEALTSQGVTDLYAPESSQVLWATTGKYGGTNGVWKSTDEGRTFSPAVLSDAKLYFTGIRGSKSAAQRLYVSAWWYEPLLSRLFVSDDGGDSWTDAQAALPDVGPFFVMGVSPADASRVFAWLGSNAGDFLVRSTDSGKTFSTVLQMDSARRGLVFSDDGQTVWLATQRRIYRSTNAGADFIALAAPTGNACIHRAGETLYACGDSLFDGWAVGKSLSGGNDFSAQMSLKDVAGIWRCPAGTPVHERCEPLWSVLRDQLAAASTAPRVEEEPSPHKGCQSGGAGLAPWLLGCAGIAGLRRARRSKTSAR